MQVFENKKSNSQNPLHKNAGGKAPFFAGVTIGASADQYKGTADCRADEVRRMPINEQSFFNPGPTGLTVQRKCKDCEEQGKLNRKESSSQPFEGQGDVTSYIGSLSSKGSPLSNESRKFFESRFGYDFSDVKIHNDTIAAKSAQSINAVAYTTGNNIVFNENQFSPESEKGKKLLAHELTHVVQQKGEENVKIQREGIDEGFDSESVSLNSTRDNAAAGTTSNNISQCAVSPGILNSDCVAYSSNSWWLPLAYVNNATCACNTTPNSPKYNCIRKFLQGRLASAPTWLKVAAAAAKVNELPGTPQYALYEAFVQSTLTPGIYQDHVDAYSSCCCPSGPASYPAWIGVTTVPILPCSLVGWSIKNYGNCEGTPGVW